MPSFFPNVDRNRLVCNASKQLLHMAAPASWHLVDLAGDSDFGFDIQVQVAVDGGIQHAFRIQLKGTESPNFIAEGATLSFPLNRRTLNLYANVVEEVMLVVASVVLDDTGKVIAPSSKIYWQWISAELTKQRGSPFELDLSDGSTKIHIPANQTLDPSLDVRQHLDAVRDIFRAGMSLENMLQRAQALGQPSTQSYVSKLADLVGDKPTEFAAFLESGGAALNPSLPPQAHEIRALIRAGNTGRAEAELERLGPKGLGSTPMLQAAFLSLRGKTLVHRRKRGEAIQLFEQAYALDPSAEHFMPLAEMRFLMAVDDPADPVRIAEVRDSLSHSETDDALSLRVRVHVALREFAEAESLVERISPAEQLMPRLVLLSAQRQWHQAIELAVSAEAAGNLSLSDLTGLQLVASRAAWCGATADAGPLQQADELPLAGAVGTKMDLARQAWTLGLKALHGLRSLGWSPNTEILAPIICGVAGILGHQAEALVLLNEAATHRPEYPDLQLHTELLAIKADEPEKALAINMRQPATIEVLTRRTALCCELRRFAECLAAALAVARSTETPSRRTPMALAMGIAAAHRLGQLVDATELKKALESRPEWDDHVYFAEFARQGVLQPHSDASLGALREGIAKHPDSWVLVANLFSNLMVSEEALASEAISLAKILRRWAMLTADESVHLVAAHTTLKNWQEAAAEVTTALERFGNDDRLLAMGAVAEEMLGHTGAAYALLERALAVGTQRISAVHNYMGLSLRLGRIDAVRSAIDKLLGLVTNQDERRELMRLSALIYVQQGQHAEAVAAVEGLGTLVSKDDEEQEGIFINTFLAVAFNGPVSSRTLQAQAEQRMKTFSAKWPLSRMFRIMERSDEQKGALSVHDLQVPLVGDPHEQAKEFECRERQAKQGELPVPFALRPGFLFRHIGNPFDLWDLSMRSRTDELQYHLTMVAQEGGLKSPKPERDVPLLDLSSLLILDSLGLFDELFAVFKRVAIPCVTVAYLSQHSNGVLARGKSAALAKSILDKVNDWVDRIDQPSVYWAPKQVVLSSTNVWGEYSQLAKQGKWLNYCDDAICRALITSDDPSAHFCTTIDLLDLLDAGKEMTEQEIAGKLALLAKWNVGISISNRFLIASLTDAWPDGKAGDASKRADAFRDHEMFSTLSRAIWHPAKSVPDLVRDMAHLLVSMLQKSESNADSAAAVLATWFNRVRFMKQADGLGWHVLCFPVLLAIKIMPEHVCGRLVSVLQRAVPASVAEHQMSVALEAEVIKVLGGEVGSLSRRDGTSSEALLQRLHIVMPVGTADGDVLMSGYVEQLQAALSST